MDLRTVGCFILSVVISSIPVASYAMDGYEPDDTWQQASHINTNGSPQLHDFDPIGDEDWVSFECEIEHSYLVGARTLNEDCFVYLVLYDTDGTTIIKGGSSGGDGYDQVLSHNCGSPGTYYVKVFDNHPAPQAGQEYDISVTGTYSGSGGAVEWTTSWFSYDNPSSIAWGDFDRDGDLDLALGMAVGARYPSAPDINKVYENTGNGFSLYWSATEADTTSSVTWGDYDGDGTLDLAVGNYGEPNKVYVNTGSGFSLVWTATVSDKTRSVAWGDYDNDGDLDLAVGNGYNLGDSSGGVSNYLYRNSPSGFEGFVALGEIDENTQSVAWGNFDNDPDGYLDLAVGNFGQPNKVYTSTGAGLLLAWESSQSELTTSVAWGDCDGDGHMDLAVAGGGNTPFGDGERSKIYMNTGGDFPHNGNYLVGDEIDTHEIAWGDYDNDGDLDLALGFWQQSGGGIVLRENAGDYPNPYFSDVKVLGSTIGIFAWGDYDNDGDLDLAGHGMLPLEVIENMGVGFELTSPFAEEDGTQSIAWGDYDGDGDLDLAVGNVPVSNEGGNNRVYENTGGGFTLAWSSAEEEYTYNIAWGDYDGDGDLDLAVGSYGGDTLETEPNRVYENTGGGFSPDSWSSLEEDRTRSIAWGDYDNDGDLDLAVGNYRYSGDEQANRVYENTGNPDLALRFSLYWTFAEEDATQAIAWGDYDGDGDLDLVAGGSPNNRLYENTGDPDPALRFSLVWTFFEEVGRSFAWGDYDGDGDLDLAMGSVSDRNIVLENTGNPDPALRFSQVWSDESYGAYSVAWGDYDGDGDLDLAACQKIYTNTGSPDPAYRFSEAWLNASAIGHAKGIAWGDYDGDGDLDLALGMHGGASEFNILGGPNHVYINRSFPTGLNSSSLLPNNPATAEIQTPSGIVGGDGSVEIHYTLYDQESDWCSVIPGYSINGGLTWLDPTPDPASEGTTGLTSSPGGTAHSFTWDNFADKDVIQTDTLGMLFGIKVVPNPGKTTIMQRITTARTSPFHLDIPPTFPEVEINDDDLYTPSTLVDLILSVRGASEINISNTGYGQGTWQDYQEEIPWGLDGLGDGPKTVYVEYRDWSDPPHVVQVLDTIVLDESEPELGAGDIIILGMSTDGVEAGWIGWDYDSGVAENFYAVASVSCEALGGLVPGDPGWDALSLTGSGWISTGSNPHLEFSYPFEEGKDYCLLVKVENGAGLATVANRELTVPVVGRVLLIAGGGDAYSNPELNTARILSDHVYTVLLDRGFDGDKIFYAAPYASSADPELLDAVDLFFDGSDDEQDLSKIFYGTDPDVWIADLNATVPLYLIMIDHGGPNQFLLDQFTSDPPEGAAYLDLEDTDTPDNDLRVWLDHLQGTTDCQVVVIYEACYSGSFIDPAGGSLSSPTRDRVLITSAGPDEKANFRYDGVVSFSQFFFDIAREGKSLYESFSQAAALLENYAFVDPQQPWLDDDRDGAYIVGSDGSVAANLYLGVDPTPPPLAFVETSINRQIEPPVEEVGVEVYGELLNENLLSEVTATLIEPDGTAGLPEPMSGTDDRDSLTADRYSTTFTFGDASPEGTYTVELNAEDNHGFKAVTRQVFIHVGPYQGDLYEDNDTWGAAAQAPLGAGPKVLNFHDDGDADWMKFLAFEGFSYKLDTWTPGDPPCMEPQVNTDLGLYRIVGGSPVPVAGVTVNDHCPPSGPDYIEEWDCGETGEYYLKITNGDVPPMSGPGSEYLLDISIMQGPQFHVKVKVFEGTTELKGAVAVAKVEAGGNSLATPWSALYNGYYRDGLSTDLSWTAMAQKAGTTTWVPQPVPPVGEGQTSVVTINLAGGAPPSPCSASAEAASAGPTKPGRQDPIDMLLYAVLFLVLVGLWRRARKRKIAGNS